MNTIIVKTLTSDHQSAPGKLADVEIHFVGGELDGFKLVGFAVWQKRDGLGQDVGFPSRQFNVRGERRSFWLPRWIAKRNAQDRLAEVVLEVYRSHNRTEGGTPTRSNGTGRTPMVPPATGPQGSDHGSE